jgi:hypothetical protein
MLAEALGAAAPRVVVLVLAPDALLELPVPSPTCPSLRLLASLWMTRASLATHLTATHSCMMRNTYTCICTHIYTQ